MPDPFALKTGDPAFDPHEPVTVNGFLYVPADRTAAIAPSNPTRRTVESAKRERRLVERTDR